jgi:hypothetical protein
MRITALTTLWIYLIYIWKRRGLRVAAIHGLSVAGVLSLSFLPFLGVGLARLKYLFFDALVDFAAKGTWQQPLSMLAAGGILKAVGMERVLMPLQISGLVLIGLFYRMSRDQSFRLFAGLSAFAYAYFLWLSTFIYIYYWFFPILMMSVLYLIESRTPPKAGSMAADMHGGDGADSSVTCSQATP